MTSSCILKEDGIKEMHDGIFNSVIAGWRVREFGELKKPRKKQIKKQNTSKIEFGSGKKIKG